VSNSSPIIPIQKVQQSKGFSASSSGPVSNLFRTALDKMLVQKDWLKASQNLTSTKKEVLCSKIYDDFFQEKKESDKTSAAKKESSQSTAQEASDASAKKLSLEASDLTKVLDLLSRAGLGQEQLNSLAAQTPQKNGGFDLQDLLARAQESLTGKSLPSEGSTTKDGSSSTAGATANAKSGFANEQGKTFKLPAEQASKWQELFVKAGMSSEKAQNIFGSTETQSKGISLTELNTMLGGKKAGFGQEASSGQQIDGLQWQGLALSSADLPKLTVMLGKAGVSTEAMKSLTERNQSPTAPIRLQEVWTVLKNQLQQSAATQTVQSSPNQTNPNQANPNQANPNQTVQNQITHEDLAAWKDMFVKAGLNDKQATELVQTLSPGSADKFLQGLVNLAPSDSNPKIVTTSPKPEFFISQNMAVQTPTQGTNLNSNLNNGGSSPEQKNLSSGGGPATRAVNKQENGPSQSSTNNSSYLSVTQGGKPNANQLTSDLIMEQENELPKAGGATGTLHELENMPFPGTAANPPGLTAPSQSFNNTSVTGGYSRIDTWGQFQSQLKDGLLQNLKPGESQLSLNLNPPELGNLQLQLSLKDNVLQATIMTANKSVAQAVTEHLTELQQALTQQGINVEQIQVQLSSSQFKEELAFNRGPSGEGQGSNKKGKANWMSPKKSAQASSPAQSVGRINNYA
jgi:flagellar hook-length control protein FliK